MSETTKAMAIALAASLFLLGCTGISEGDKCTGQTHVTINGVTKACVDGKMTGSCAVEGKVYAEDSDSKIVCQGGIWLSKDKGAGQEAPPAGTPQPPAAQPPAETEERCGAGKGFASANGVTSACVGGFWMTDCTAEGEVYMVTSFDTKIVCEGGIWVEKELAPGENVTVSEPEEPVEEGPCFSPSWESSDNVTRACIDGVMTTECSTEGEVYDESEFLETKIVCEGGVWVSKDLG